MKPRIKKLWLKALRSGEYKQAKNGLKKINREGQESFCCLGVLCDLHAKAHDLKWVKSRQSTYGTYLRSSGYLPKAVRLWAGIKTDNGRFYKKPIESSNLSQVNDAIGSSFEKVATVIEKYF